MTLNLRGKRSDALCRENETYGILPGLGHFQFIFSVLPPLRFPFRSLNPTTSIHTIFENILPRRVYVEFLVFPKHQIDRATLDPGRRDKCRARFVVTILDDTCSSAGDEQSSEKMILVGLIAIAMRSLAN
jgi:hypothetical protein